MPSSFEVLDFSAAEIAAMMETSTTSVNSALSRARRTLERHTPDATQQRTLRTLGDVRVREIVSGFAAALERGDRDALVALLVEDVSWSMPPLPRWYRGMAAVTDFAVRVPLTGCGSWQHRQTSANAQPAVASYLRRAGEDVYSAWAINVLTLDDDRIAEVTSFIGGEHFASFGLPPSLP